MPLLPAFLSRGLKIEPSCDDDPCVPQEGKPQDGKVYQVKDLNADNDRKTLQEVWAQYQNETNPVFFCREKIVIAEDGGLAEVPSLFHWSRFLGAGIMVACVVMNLYVLLVPNIAVLARDDVEWFFEGGDDPSYSQLGVTGLTCYFHPEGKLMEPGVELAFLELAMLALLIAQAAYMAATVVVWKFHPSHAWYSIARFFWDFVPEVSTLSAMKMLYFVAPSIVAPDLTRIGRLSFDKEFRDMKFKDYGWLLLNLLIFAVTRGVAGVVGFETFMVKFLKIARAMEKESTFAALLLALSFINQLLGIVQVRKISRDRLFLYLFGGEDCFVNAYEEKVAHTWMARLARRMWEVAHEKDRYTFPKLWFLAIALAYGDNDFQKLTLNGSMDRRALAAPGPLAEPATSQDVVPLEEALRVFGRPRD